MFCDFECKYNNCFDNLLTLAKQIWLIIIKIMSELSQVLDINTEMFMENLLCENETVTKK